MITELIKQSKIVNTEIVMFVRNETIQSDSEIEISFDKEHHETIKQFFLETMNEPGLNITIDLPSGNKLVMHGFKCVEVGDVGLLATTFSAWFIGVVMNKKSLPLISANAETLRNGMLATVETYSIK